MTPCIPTCLSTPRSKLRSFATSSAPMPELSRFEGWIPHMLSLLLGHGSMVTIACCDLEVQPKHTHTQTYGLESRLVLVVDFFPTCEDAVPHGQVKSRSGDMNHKNYPLVPVKREQVIQLYFSYLDVSGCILLKRPCSKQRLQSKTQQLSI